MHFRSVVLSTEFQSVFSLACCNKSRLPMLRVLFGRSRRSDTLDTNILSVVGVNKVVDCIGRACNPLAFVRISAALHTCPVYIRRKSNDCRKRDSSIDFAVNVNPFVARFTNRRIVSARRFGQSEHHLRNRREVHKVRKNNLRFIREVCKLRTRNPIARRNSHILPRNRARLAVAFKIRKLVIPDLHKGILNKVVVERVVRRVVVSHAILLDRRHP